ncbi:MAG: GNAT family N-acetyltransferase [Gammaproteobacteria bacterium]|nr:GNAT family N-acetyltransferase [Gammaproteobacteria bacterium]
MTKIRSATSADVDTLAAFNIAMALETEDKHLPEDTIRPGVQRFIDNSDLGFYLLAEREGEVAGCLAITFEWSDWRNGLFWWIQSVYIHPDHRRAGVFRQLYSRVTELAAGDSDVCGIRLYVEKDNARAQQTYTSLGMSETDYRLFEALLP